MATTVRIAFQEFMKDYVNLDKSIVSTARNSRDWLISKLNSLSDVEDNGFPSFYKEKHLGFGSFARSTKKRELDDIDHLICMSSQGCTYSEFADTVYINVPESAGKPFVDLKHAESDTLNSTRVINLFVKSLKSVPQYINSERHARSGEAATLKLSSYTWNFDIIPCFFTREDNNGKTYYIMPDGKGNWKKTDPRIDAVKSKVINQRHNGNVLSIIRIMKYWNQRSTMKTMGSYLLENMILNYYSYNGCSNIFHHEVKKILGHIAHSIYFPVDDPKGIQGNINTLSYDEQLSISTRAHLDHDYAIEACELENTDMKKAMEKWRSVFGSNFPIYSGS